MLTNTMRKKIEEDPFALAGHIGASTIHRVGVPYAFLSAVVFPAVGEFRKGMEIQSGGLISFLDNGSQFARAGAWEPALDVLDNFIESFFTKTDEQGEISPLQARPQRG